MTLLKKDFSASDSDIRNIFKRIIHRDFSGNTGEVVKNSFYQSLTQIVAKGGSFVFTAILARILMPELFGLYNLALSTIIIFATISELGIGQTLIRYVSKELGKGDKQEAKKYFVYLRKIKFILVGISIAFLLISAKYVSENYYQKPIFLALVAGGLYILFFEVVSFLTTSLQSFNYFKGVLSNEFVLEPLRIVLVSLTALFSIKYAASNQLILFWLILALFGSYLLAAIFMRLTSFRKSNPFGKEKSKPLDKDKKRNVNKFILASSALLLSSTIFVYIDRLMLGHFVSAEAIGYYSAAIGFIGAVTTVAAFGTVLLPTFSRLGASRAKTGLKKSLKITSLFSGALLILTLALSSLLIWLIYGPNYGPSVNMLRILSVNLILVPLTGVYNAYLFSRGEPKKILKVLIIATVVNIFLNYVLIQKFLIFGDVFATYGAIIATITSNLIYFIGVMILSNNKKTANQGNIFLNKKKVKKI